jgi:hypothetical protein
MLRYLAAAAVVVVAVAFAAVRDVWDCCPHPDTDR